MSRFGKACQSFLLALARNEVVTEPRRETIKITVDSAEAHEALAKIRLDARRTHKAIAELNQETERMQFRNGPHCN